MDHKSFLKHYNSDGTQKTPISEYPKEMLDKMKRFADGSFSFEMISKSKYTIRGSLIGLVAGAATGMYFKKSVFFFALMGSISGLIGGHLFGTYMINKGLTNQNTKKDEKSEPTT